MSEPSEAQLRNWQYACKICVFSAPTVGKLFDHIEQVHEKEPLSRKSRVPLILPPHSAPPQPPPPEVDVEDFIQYNTIIRPLEEGGEVRIKQEEDSIVIEESEPSASARPTVFGCPLCKFESRNEGKVQRHINRHQQVEEEMVSIAAAPAACVDKQVLPDDGIYECGLCHDQTGSIEAMIEHMVVVHQIQ